MTLDVRTLAEGEVQAFQDLVDDVFGADHDPAEQPVWRPLIENDRTWVAWDGTVAAGCAATATFEMTVPGGGPVPAAGVTGVGVAATHRRQGVASTLMRTQLDSVRERGTESFATLWASEPVIYGRFGYGVASRRLHVTVEAHDPAMLGTPPTGAVRRVDVAGVESVARRLYDAERAWRPGLINRTDERWAVRMSDLPSYRHGAGEQRCVVYERSGSAEGYALYRVKAGWTDGRPSGSVHVKELLATDADAHAGLWRYLLGVDLMRSVSYDNVPPDDPLPDRLADPRAIRHNVTDGLYVRLLDVPAALASRRYAVPGSVVVEVRDACGGWAAGRYAVEGGPDGATCTPTSESADLTMSVVELSAAYLGHTTLRSLHGAGRVDEETPGAVERASAMLAWPVAPWCPEIF